MVETYSVTVSCSNCGYHGSVTISKGTTVSSENCPNCGCSSITNDSYAVKPYNNPYDAWPNIKPWRKLEPWNLDNMRVWS